MRATYRRDREDIFDGLQVNFTEHALSFRCQDDWLLGIASIPAVAAARGMVILVGGPQYRIGSHRQFTLLARDMAAAGVPVLRFDYRGMGDSEGNRRHFEDIGEDLRAAIDAFMAAVPSLKEIVIWGLCDAASAAAFYAHEDRRVTGLVLLNPWVRTETGLAQTYLKHYYLGRLTEPGMWKKIASGKFNYVSAARSFAAQVVHAFSKNGKTAAASDGRASDKLLPDRMHQGLAKFHGRILIILSGNDLTAQEFGNAANKSAEWRKLLKSERVMQYSLPEANHTFSRKIWRDQVSTWTLNWVKRC